MSRWATAWRDGVDDYQLNPRVEHLLCGGEKMVTFTLDIFNAGSEEFDSTSQLFSSARDINMHGLERLGRRLDVGQFFSYVDRRSCW